MDKIELTLEKQLSLRHFKNQVEKMNLEQAKTMLVELFEHKLVQEQTYKELMMNSWFGRLQ